jgi:hypothetical protein
MRCICTRIYLMNDIVQRAVDAAQQHYSASDWSSLRPQERTAAVYREMRRLDAEAAKPLKHHHRQAGQQQPTGQPPAAPTSAGHGTAHGEWERLRRSG